MTERDFWLKEATLDDIAGKPPVDLQQCLDAIVPEIAPAVKSRSQILEIGCGVGRLTIPVQKHFKTAEVIGIDISEQFLAIARKQKTKARFWLTDKVPKPIDAAYTMLVFQHLPNVQKLSYIFRVAEALNPGGIFRFQVVIGDGPPLPNRHETTMRDIERWCADGKLEITKVDEGLIFPMWTWITAVKND